jgi:hypothetical protein
MYTTLCLESALEVPSPEFVIAIARLLETEPDDMLRELGYERPRESVSPRRKANSGSRGRMGLVSRTRVAPVRAHVR